MWYGIYIQKKQCGMTNAWFCICIINIRQIQKMTFTRKRILFSHAFRWCSSSTIHHFTFHVCHTMCAHAHASLNKHKTHPWTFSCTRRDDIYINTNTPASHQTNPHHMDLSTDLMTWHSLRVDLIWLTFIDSFEWHCVLLLLLRAKRGGLCVCVDSKPMYVLVLALVTII